ncbi:MAG: hypothetical protein LH629_13925 [Ignavibacteria bacterium]|nr:hypothetical protein [Ignavibacteria bacterium]
MLTKEKVLESMKDLPDKFSADELIERIIFLQKIDTGLQQSLKGKSIPTKDAKEQLSKWLK